MTKNIVTHAMNRRAVILSGGGAVGAAALGGIAAQASSLPYDLQNPPTWENVTNTEMRAFMRDRFWLQGDDGFSGGMRLVRTKAVNSGPARPKHLPRSEGFTAMFVSSHMKYFIENGAQVVTVGHEVLGYQRLYLTAVKRKNGYYFLEAELN